MTSWRRAGALAGLVTMLGLLLAAPAAAAPAGDAPAAAAGAAQASEWEIRSFDADIEIATDGSLQITETLEVTFHARSRGIFREIPFRVPVDGSTVRRYDFDRIEVQTSAGAPDDLDRERDGDFLIWRIGDPDTYITGEHTYTISYRVRGALNRFDSHDELFWNVTGDRWQVPIQRATATVHAPEISEVSCFAGRTGGTDPCADASHDGEVATFTADELRPGSQLDVVVAVPPGLVDVAPPVLEPANPVLRAFRVDPIRVGGAAVIGLAGLAGVVALARRGRDERAPHAAGALPGGVEYRPPDGLRPAQLRTLLTQRVDDVSLSATLVDLAVRGHVRIEEANQGKWNLFGKQDWIIHRLQTTDGVQPYEQEVLQGLFAKPRALSQLGGAKPAAVPPGGTAAVQVSSLSDGSFHKHYQRIQKMLYTDVVHRGYFRHDPSAVRIGFTALALLVLAAGVAGIFAMFSLDLTYALVLAPLPVVGLLLLLFSQHAPRRTAAGATMNRRAQGFREFVRTAETDRMEFAERERIFVEYLPYAMAFGCVDGWVKAFERIGVPAAAAAGTWYVGHGPMDIRHMTSSMSNLSSQVGGSMRKTASSGGSSGFSGGSSGGGGGGGGGGRW